MTRREKLKSILKRHIYGAMTYDCNRNHAFKQIMTMIDYRDKKIDRLQKDLESSLIENAKLKIT